MSSHASVTRSTRDAVTRPGARSWLRLPQPSEALHTTRLLAQRADRRSTSKDADYRSRARAGVHLEAGMLSRLGKLDGRPPTRPAPGSLARPHLGSRIRSPHMRG